ncbi:vacuolar DHA amino acid exporter [Stereum hirsutum FP-91666 SS1]|uniref:vacuolar DHA amino acid exporter n=1 Tax=Stereum hirsutum (strain FP-91666) TaxID=721885 RepID=UPI000440CAEA|nr:vacuolar DHA amino acid exporter [Stereum hirsutum FP-91666 SS1]EIM87023.1 vacuolar DHA amino acid exporter [Stereum hirsutum FP-91666 SS1]
MTPSHQPPESRRSHSQDERSLRESSGRDTLRHSFTPSVESEHDESLEVEVDIEHTAVADDPRKWSSMRKSMILLIVSGASMLAGFGSNIYNPAIPEIESDLHASSSDISLSLAVFILIQGGIPIAWSALSEIKGRKIVYILSIGIGLIGCIVASLAKTTGVLLGMRVLQAVGSSSVLSIGAATLADIYEPHERGTMMGIYISAPLLGPALGPIIGGLLTQYFSWRATFWFLAVLMAVCLVAFLGAFKDTFRRERSVAYQTALRRVVKGREEKRCSESDNSEKTGASIASAGEHEKPSAEVVLKEVHLSFKDVNPVPPLLAVLSRWNNIVILIASAFDFGFAYSIVYTCALTLSDKYGYNALQTGLVLIPFGVGNVLGSVLGGRWSDRILKHAKARLEPGCRPPPEVRLRSGIPAMFFFPLSVAAYGWLAQERIHIATICVSLFFVGFFSIWIYSSTVAYIVDSNVGRSSTAVATNSLARSLVAFLFAEVAVPLQDSIGDGGLYSLWTGILIICELLLLLVLYKGGKWREKAEEREVRSRR